MTSVFIPCETKVREFDSRMLLGYHLALAGYSVYIGSKGGIKREVFYSKNAIYLPKSVSKTEVDFYKKLKENNTRIVLHHAEGGIYYKEFKESILYCYPLEIMSYVDLIFVFGNEIKKAIHEYLPSIDPTKVIVSGDPRFDLLKLEYRPLFKETGKYILSKYKNYILINTSFGLANPRMGHDWVKEYYTNSPDISELQREHIFLKIDITTEVMNRFISFAKKLAIARPDLNIVLRPHPEESLAIYYKEFEGIPNIFPVLEGSAQNWIFSAKAVVHYDCTTGIESVIAGKNTYAYVPLKDDSILAWLPVFVSKEFTNEDQLVNALASSDFSKNEPYLLNEDKRQVLSGFVNNILENSSEIIAENVKNKIPKLNTNKPNNLKLVFKRLKTYPNYYRAKSKAEKNNLKLKFPKVDVKEVLNHLTVFDSIYHKKNKFQVNSFGRDVVKFSLK